MGSIYPCLHQLLTDCGDLAVINEFNLPTSCSHLLWTGSGDLTVGNEINLPMSCLHQLLYFVNQLHVWTPTELRQSIRASAIGKYASVELVLVQAHMQQVSP